MTSTYHGVGSGGWEQQPRPWDVGGDVNVGRIERWISGLAGLALVGYGLRRKRIRGVLLPLGANLIVRGITGRCPVNRAIGRNSALGEGRTSPVASRRRGEGTRVEESVAINRAREDLFRFWRNFENLPRFMDNLESVTRLDDRHSHWVAKGPAGTRVEWDAEIHNEIENELIAWRALPGSEVDHAGSVHFHPLADKATEVRVMLRYSPPAGKRGSAAAKLAGEDPARQVADDLRRFKQVTEAGEFSPA
jgi:uncharacterized membrane protein